MRRVLDVPEIEVGQMWYTKQYQYVYPGDIVLEGAHSLLIVHEVFPDDQHVTMMLIWDPNYPDLIGTFEAVPRHRFGNRLFLVEGAR